MDVLFIRKCEIQVMLHDIFWEKDNLIDCQLAWWSYGREGGTGLGRVFLLKLARFLAA